MCVFVVCGPYAEAGGVNDLLESSTSYIAEGVLAVPTLISMNADLQEGGRVGGGTTVEQEASKFKALIQGGVEVSACGMGRCEEEHND